MSGATKVVALCCVGNLGKNVCEELLADGRYRFVVISRQSTRAPFFEQRNIDVRTSDYSTESVLSILDDTDASTFISFNNNFDESFVTLHRGWLEACRRSKNCKRFIPSEYCGNIDDYPEIPSLFKTSRIPFRQVLDEEKEIEWTIFNNGWLMDYFLTEDKSTMPPIPNEFPIDPNGWKACIRGSGDDVQSFSSTRDIAKALIALLDAPNWDHHTYITGQWATFNEMVKIMEDFYGQQMPKTYRSEEDVRRDTRLPPTDENMDAIYLASVEEMMMCGSGACPREKTLQQRAKFFKGLSFTTLEDLLLSTGSKRGVAAHSSL